MSERGVLAAFGDPALAAAAVRALHAGGHLDVRAAMPAPFPPLMEALGRPRSRIDHLVLTAATVGVACGFALCIGTSLAWPLPTGGKPIASIPPFVIIAFELSVLLGAGVNLSALAWFSARARRSRPFPPDARFSGDRIGLFVYAGSDEEASAVEQILRAEGAGEVKHVV